jgi:tetratricopeptide (TPR) repeat protein
MEEEMKKCPYCYESINLDAVVCRYCGRDLIDPDYEYKTVYFDRIESGMFFIPDQLRPGQIPPTDTEAKEHLWFDGGRKSVKEKLKDEFAQGWEVNGELTYDGIILRKNHYLAYNNEYVTSVSASFECQLKRRKETSDPETEYWATIENDPYNADAYYDLGSLLEGQDRYKEAEAVYRKWIQKMRNDPEAYYHLGRALSEQKKNKKAEAAFRKVIMLDKKHYRAYSQLGLLLMGQNKSKEAEICFTTAIKLNPKDALSFEFLGLLYNNQKKYKRAENVLTTAKRLDPKLLFTDYLIGVSYVGLNRKEEALRAFQKAIRKNPDDADAYNMVGALFDGKRMYKKAEKAFREAIDHDPANYLGYAGLANSLRMAGQLDEAISNFEKSHKMQPRMYTAISLAGIYKQQNKLKQVSKYVIIARKFLEPKDFYELVCLESISGNIEKAFRALVSAKKYKQLDKSWAWKDPDLAPLREDPRFVKIVGRKSK